MQVPVHVRLVIRQALSHSYYSVSSMNRIFDEEFCS